VRLVAQEEECGPGEPYEPIDVELLFGENTVALRGPWNTTDLVKIGPAAADLVDRYEGLYARGAYAPRDEQDRLRRVLATTNLRTGHEPPRRLPADSRGMRRGRPDARTEGTTAMPGASHRPSRANGEAWPPMEPASAGGLDRSERPEPRVRPGRQEALF